jgi:hypothetical protein
MKKLYVSPTIESERISTPKAWACYPVNPNATNWDESNIVFTDSPYSLATEVSAHCGGGYPY